MHRTRSKVGIGNASDTAWFAHITTTGTNLYCHGEPPLTSGKLCFIINFIGGGTGEAPIAPFEPPLHLLSLRQPKGAPSKVNQTFVSGLNWTGKVDISHTRSLIFTEGVGQKCEIYLQFSTPVISETI